MPILKTIDDSWTTNWNELPDVSLPSSTTPGSLTSRGRVLVIRYGQADVLLIRWALRALHVESAWVRGGLEGIAVLRRTPFDLVLVDEELPDMSGADVIRTLKAEYDSSRFVILKGATAASQTAHAMNGDASGTLERPYRCTDVIAVVNSVLGLHAAEHRAFASMAPAPAVQPAPPAIRISRKTVGSVAERWAHFVLGAIDAENDPKTVTRWARVVGVSRSVLSECCRLVHVAPQEARDFTRLLRAISHSGEQWQPETVLDLADVRTLRKLLSRAGLSGPIGRTPTMPQFLEHQHWIPQTNPGMMALRSLLFDDTRYAG
jgi:DNA-binding response OmpR family regulator